MPIFGKTDLERSNMNEEFLLQYLKDNCPGRKNTRKSAVIERALNISGYEVRRLVNRLRKKGKPIGSSKDGYFYAVTAGEIYATIRQLEIMKKGLEAAIHGMESALDDCPTDGE